MKGAMGSWRRNFSPHRRRAATRSTAGIRLEFGAHVEHALCPSFADLAYAALLRSTWPPHPDPLPQIVRVNVVAGKEQPPARTIWGRGGKETLKLTPVRTGCIGLFVRRLLFHALSRRRFRAPSPPDDWRVGLFLAQVMTANDLGERVGVRGRSGISASVRETLAPCLDAW